MAESTHIFKLELPNGAKLHIEGGERFVNEKYGDVKSAAVTLMNHAAAATSRDQVLDRMLSAPDANTSSPSPQLQPHKAISEPGSTSAPPQAAKSSTKKPKGKADPARRELSSRRKELLEKIKSTVSFDASDAYTAAIQSATAPLDRAALVARMAQEKFGVEDGLSPVEIRWLLSEKFLVGQDARSLEEAMQGASTNFFLRSPSPYDGRAKLYKPMRECIARAKELIVSGTASDQAGANAATVAASN